MSDQIEENAGPGEDVFRPAETQVGKILRREGQHLPIGIDLSPPSAKPTSEHS